MKLIFKGTVQGVGFRPTIYRIAKDMGLKGYVLNKGSEVEIVIDKNKDEFIKQVKKNLPRIAEISEIVEKKDPRVFKDFEILYSKQGKKHSLIPPDVGTCEKCLKEIFNPEDRRYLYPFTNCTVCGARYSLIEEVPYDRERTSMKKFPMCKTCQKEYDNALNRRYHAQTISCPECGPQYSLYDKNKKNLGSKDAILNFSKRIDDGEIGVIKSWGGMHLSCRIDNIDRFRNWYKRPQKSFAIMVKDMETAGKYGEINDFQKQLLLSDQKPIALLKKKQAEKISPGLNTIGVFLPYTGLHHILFSFLKSDALIMTSANIPGEPMLTGNNEVFSLGADCYLLHNRDIPVRVDDSVIKTWKKNIFFLRKSRGFIPDEIKVGYKHRVLSVGPDENIAGALSVNSNVYSTQYIGNSRYYSTLVFLENSLRHLMKILMEKPDLDAVAVDLHPAYDSRVVGRKFADEFSAELLEVQHDWAHAASLLLDNKVSRSVVIVLEGLGYGLDNTFWGGEVLDTGFTDFKRVGHLGYIPLLGGDKATMDPRRLVFAIFKKLGKQIFFSGKEAEILSKLMDKSPLSCSMGRYLDALSCYLGVCTKRTYSGEPAMKLEKYLEMGKKTVDFEINIKNNIIDVIDLFRQLDEKKKDKKITESKKADLIFSFVETIVNNLVDIAANYALENNIPYIGLSGGVSYNIPITEMVEKRVKKHGLKLIVHNRIPNGDGGISIGQNVIIGNKLS